MTNEQRQQIVTEYLHASGRSDREAMRALVTEDFTVYLAPIAAEMGWENPVRGRDKFFSFVDKLLSKDDMWKPGSSHPEEFLFSDDSVAVRVRMKGEFANGYPYENEYVFIYKLRGDKICQMREFADTGYIASLRKKAAAYKG